jgi:hypothetical protein
LLIALGCTLLRPLRLVLCGRTPTPGRRLGSWRLANLSASRLRLSARGWLRALLDGRWMHGPPLILRRGTSLLRRYLPALRSGRQRALHSLRLIVLPHDSVLRLVTVIPGLQRLLLLRARISIPRVLLLVYRQRRRPVH